MKQPNRLINEKSPYLLQHAYNPVNWYPWGDEAFQKASESQKPIFLSIGYSTCHWCHVMERESFEDEGVASALNRDFICIKVDKEERPDIDAVYMTICQALTGSGGWPLSIFMTPEQKPFLAGTYYPKHRRYGHPGFLEVLEAVRQAWKSDRQKLLDSGEQIVAALSRTTSGEELPLNQKPVEDAVRKLTKSFDPHYGGFGGPPKFPMPHHLLFLLRCHHLKVGKEPLKLVEETLAAMYRGGIFDHISGGFSRYSTDEKWLAPHFEKMLYDNALLTTAYLECYQVTGNPIYRSVAEKTLAHIDREMTASEGGFYSAQDADIEGEEGKFYTFTPEEIASVLGERDGNAFCTLYDITPEGNFEGTNIPNLLRHKEASLPNASMQAMLDQLYQYRRRRYFLHKDDKILTAWNALMIVAYAKAYRILGEQSYLESGEKAYAFLNQHLLFADGSLKISYRNGKSGGVGLLDDYVFLAWACLELYESTFDAAYLERTCKLMWSVLEHFPSSSGGFYLSPQHGEALIFRPIENFDGAVPSGNSVAAFCLAKLAALTGETIWQEASDRQLSFFSHQFHEQPTAVTFALTALMQAAYPSQELVCATANDNEKIDLAIKLGRYYHPQTAILVKSPGDENALGRIADFTKSYPLPQDGQTLFYLCQNQSCSPPETNLEAILQHL